MSEGGPMRSPAAARWRILLTGAAGFVGSRLRDFPGRGEAEARAKEQEAPA